MAKKTFRRHDGRTAAQLRPVRIEPGFVRSADGSCLIEFGGTRVICTASFAEGVPAWREGGGEGWVTAEYGMLPASTGRRKSRPGLKPDSRATEIQRLIGRSLRAAVRLDRLGENTVTIDCDVLEADGGTRTASITGGFVATALAIEAARRAGRLTGSAKILHRPVAAISAGVVDGRSVLDLDYREDSTAEVDLNVVMTRGGRLIEVQGTAEGAPFSGAQLQEMLRLAGQGVRKLLRSQNEAIARGREA